MENDKPITAEMIEAKTMSQGRGNRAKRSPKFEYIYIAYEVQPFNIDDYVQNPAMIIKLHEEMKIARAASSNLQVRFEELRMDNQRLELQKQELDIKLGEAKKELERLQTSVGNSKQGIRY